MSLPTLHGTGTLISDPKTGPTKTGGTWTSVVVRFQQRRKTADSGWVDGHAEVASCIAFDEVAAILAGFGKGDSVELKGTVGAGLWGDKPQLKVTVTACRKPVRKGAVERRVAA